MTSKPNRWQHPRWHLVIVVPILILVLVEDDAITRGIGVVSLALSAFRYGFDSAKRVAVRADVNPDIRG